jgi:hypothetical protein
MKMKRIRNTMAILVATAGLSLSTLPAAQAVDTPMPPGCGWNTPGGIFLTAGYCLIDGEWWWFDWDGSYGPGLGAIR